MKYYCTQLSYDLCIVLDDHQPVPFVSHLEAHIFHIRENNVKLLFSVTFQSEQTTKQIALPLILLQASQKFPLNLVINVKTL